MIGLRVEVKFLRGIEIKKYVLRYILVSTLVILFSCASTRQGGEGKTAPQSEVKISAIQGTPFGAAEEFVGSPYKEIGKSGLFDVHSADTCRIAVLPNGDDSFTARIQTLEKADTSVRIQALIFTGDESGLYIAELLKVKESRGMLNTNIYWEAARNVFEKTGKIDMRHVTDERLNKNVRELADEKLELKYEAAKCRFFKIVPGLEKRISNRPT